MNEQNQGVNKPPNLGKSFRAKYPDMEKFIGENLINKIGIGILVIGIGLFVKYSFHLLGETGQVIVGLVSGGILMGLAHWLRKDYSAFSSVLVGGGMALMYYTLAVAFHVYHIIEQPLAFVAMVGITAFSVIQSISYNRKELAILSLLGGFLTPVMLSDGSGNYMVLFSYTLILNVGMLSLAWFKKWDFVNILSFIATLALYGAWLITRVPGDPDAPLVHLLLFGVAFYVIFFVMNVINNIKYQRVFRGWEISMLITNNALFYTAGMMLLGQEASLEKLQGLFTACMGIFNLVFTLVLFKNPRVDKNLLYLLV
ncbi:MAG: DUF2339 domain-containing protein, partial [Bacteroidetes bacterium]|nr:DUF2339 domain-containing protein [Bacteroidota bacterium]